jgi:hypothetical protein
VRRFTLALLTTLAALPFTGAGAQIIRGGRFGLRDPQTWVSATFGWQEGWTVVDGSTGSRWDLGDTQQYGGSIEHAVAGGVTVGVRAVTSMPDVRFEERTPSVLGGNGANVFPAEARVTQALGVVHVTTGRQLRSVFELGLGSTIYSAFRHQTTGETLGATRTDTDFAFSFTYGIGYSFSRNVHVDVVQDLGTSLHQKTGLEAGEDRSARIRSTRLVARYGFGG